MDYNTERFNKELACFLIPRLSKLALVYTEDYSQHYIEF